MEKSTKVQAAALEVFCTLLAKCGSHIDIQEINVDQFIERLCIDIRSAKGSTGILIDIVLYIIYVMTIETEIMGKL